VRQHDACQTVDRDGASACGFEPHVQPSRPPEYRQKPEDRDDHRQDEGRPHQRHEKPPPRKAPARQRARHGDRAQDADQRRQRRLQKREADCRKVGRAKPPRRLAASATARSGPRTARRTSAVNAAPVHAMALSG